MAQPLASVSAAAQQKSYVTYTAPDLDINAARVTLLEAPSLLASSGTTGFRTWEAALFLGAFLASDHGRNLILGEDIIELGAGTGFLSILCAKHLGARYVLATDGSREVVTNIKTNLELNKLDESEIVQTDVLQWGHALVNGPADCRGVDRSYDLAIAADVVSVSSFSLHDYPSIPS
jgi:predicted nicotinamide N-methyase